MKLRHSFAALSTLTLAAAFSSITPASALTTQVYVAKSGTNALGCGADFAAVPCQTLTYALGQVSPSGTIIIKESGIYDPVTVSQPVTILGGDGVNAYIYSTTTTPPVIVNNAATEDFKLLGVNVIAGAGTNSTVGVQINNARRIELSGSIRGFTQNAVAITPGSGSIDIFMRNMTISGHNSHCILIAPTGSATVRTVIRESRIDHCGGQGIRTDSSATSGGGFVQTNIIGSIIAYTTLNSVSAISVSGAYQNSVLVQDTTIQNTSGSGVAANGPASFINLRTATITNTQSPVLTQNGGIVNSFGDSMIFFNATAGSPTNQIPLR